MPKTTSKRVASRSSKVPDEPNQVEVAQLAARFGEMTGLVGVAHSVRPGTGGPRLLFEVAAPSELHYRAANTISEALPEESPFSGRVAVVKRSLEQLDLQAPEVKLLVRTISSSLTADRFTKPEDFHQRYVASASGAEEQISAAGNHIVFGRRGAGKSTLLVYSLHHFRARGITTIWIDMQTFEKRADHGVIADVLTIIADELARIPAATQSAEQFASRLGALRSEDQSPGIESIRKLLPDLRKALQKAGESTGGTTIFLDDLHVVSPELQPLLLSAVYSIARSNRTNLKISALEHFTRPWDAAQRLGLEPPGDAQIVHLDHNLTNPDNAHNHIKKILDSICQICGIPSIASIAGKGVIARLVWEAAGVPRDALNILQKGLANASLKRRKEVTLTDINEAASSCLDDKQRFLAMDSSAEEEALRTTLERIKDFCIKDKKYNAFVVALKHENSEFQRIQKLVDLRFLHVLSAGFTRSNAGTKMTALLLDYGFYTGARRAKTVDVLQKQPGRLSYQALRKMPVLVLADEAA